MRCRPKHRNRPAVTAIRTRAGESTPELAAAAQGVLRSNDRGSITVAAPRLYPHQWSWDAAFVAIGLARFSVPRAITELRSLLRGQWRTGMIPHIVFSDDPGYFPGPDRWRTAVAAAAPGAVLTSGICQPPVHSIAVYQIMQAGRSNGGSDRAAADRFLDETFDAWLVWHRWLADTRDPDSTGLVQIHHSWESGMDNSPRWDAPYAGVRPGVMAPFTRRDTRHVADPDERPSDRDYQRYLWLVEQMVHAGYDDEVMRFAVDFRVGDVFVSALLCHSSELLATLADDTGRWAAADELRAIAERCRSGVLRSLSPSTGLARDFDARTGRWIDSPTVAGFAPLLCLPAGSRRDAQHELLLGESWCGHPDLRYALPPTTSPAVPQFRRRTYWRGPQWPVINWLFCWTAQWYGDHDLAAMLREQSLAQLSDRRFAEYYDPLSGDPLGSDGQSWTAAVALDWTSNDVWDRR